MFDPLCFALNGHTIPFFDLDALGVWPCVFGQSVSISTIDTKAHAAILKACEGGFVKFRFLATMGDITAPIDAIFNMIIFPGGAASGVITTTLAGVWVNVQAYVSPTTPEMYVEAHIV